MKPAPSLRFASLLLVFAALPLAAQAPRELTVDWIYGDEAAAVSKIPKFAWTSGDELLILDETRPPATRTIERVAAKTGARGPAVDAAAALASLKALSPRGTPDALPWPEALDPAGRTAIYLFGDDLYALDLASSRFERLTRTDAAESLPRVSPDGRKVAFVRSNDLWVLDLATKAETRLTSDGSDTILNGTLSWLYWEEIFDRGDTGYWWSPDSSAIAFLRTDESPVDVSLFTDFAPAVPRVIKQRYPRTGGANPTVRLGIADVSGKAIAWMEPSEVPYEYVLGVDWLPDSRAVAVQTTNRAQTRLDVWRFDRAGAKATRVAQRHGPGPRLPEGAPVRRGREDLDRVLRDRRPHPPLPLRRGRGPPERDHPGTLVGPRRAILRRAPGLGVRRRGERRRLLHGDREIVARVASLPHPARRHGDGADHEGGRHAQGDVLARPPLLRRRLLEPERAAFGRSLRRLRPARGDARGKPDGPPSPLTPWASASSSRSPPPTGSRCPRAC